MNNLMIALGFGESGYVAQGGDLGSFVSRQLAIEFDECKGMFSTLILICKR
jgi:microsomal epoxide hydrolase